MEKNNKKKCLHVCNWVTLPHSRDWHSIVNQLHFDKKKFKKTQISDSKILPSVNISIYTCNWDKVLKPKFIILHIELRKRFLSF